MDAKLEMKDFIQPFERKLALLELKALSQSVPAEDGGESNLSEFSISGNFDTSELICSLAYWRSVNTSTSIPTGQIRAEATSLVAGNGLDLASVRSRNNELVPNRLPNRRCLRYASHGLHEYRGKFFPQLVRALCNIASVPKSGLIVDPMCGSGTTVVEAKSMGRHSIGFDINPLSVFLSDVKARALSFDPDLLILSYQYIHNSLENGHRASGDQLWRERYSEGDQAYLNRWFAATCLNDIEHILSVLDSLECDSMRDYFRVCLSNVLRPASYQKVDDLRIRREERTYSPGDLQCLFLNFSHRSVKLLVAYLVEMMAKCSETKHTVVHGDARSFSDAFPGLKNSVDAIITSPPYATALPYLDTDRLSLIVLSLLERSDHRARDLEMIGNREVTTRMRQKYWENFEKNRSIFPDGTIALIDRIHELNLNNDVGFRRKNLSALLSKYFLDMRCVLTQSLNVLRPGAPMFLVVGNNRTTAGGEEICIDTTVHLEEIAELIGFERVDCIDMDMLSSRDIFRANAMPSEQILWLKKAQ